MPTDSVVAFYLFAAYLDAPGWQFPLQPAPEGGRCASRGWRHLPRLCCLSCQAWLHVRARAEPKPRSVSHPPGTRRSTRLPPTRLPPTLRCWPTPLSLTPLAQTPPARGAPLYLGTLRSRPPASYSALLAFRPDKPGPGAAAVIGSNLASREPRYSWLAEGQVVTFEGRDGAFHALLLFLSYHASKRQGLLGGRYLAELAGLEAVLRGGGAAPSVPQRVWDYWFPLARY